MEKFTSILFVLFVVCFGLSRERSYYYEKFVCETSKTINAMSVDATYTFEPVADFDVKSAKDKTLVLPRRDPVKFIEAREQRVRERFVNLAEARLLREELKQCYYREGVNHYQNCRELVQTYLAKIKQHEFGSVAVKDGF